MKKFKSNKINLKIKKTSEIPPHVKIPPTRQTKYKVIDFASFKKSIMAYKLP